MNLESVLIDLFNHYRYANPPAHITRDATGVYLHLATQSENGSSVDHKFRVTGDRAELVKEEE